MPLVSSYDGFAVNAATGYRTVINPSGTDAPWGMSPNLRQRLNQPPALDSATYTERRIPFRIDLVKSGISIDTFASNVGRYFTPNAGARTLLATADDGTTALTIQASVSRLAPLPGWKAFVGEFLCVDPLWKAVTTAASPDATSPLTVGGNYKALPTITITPSTSTLKRRRVTITDNTGTGLAAYIIQATFDSTTVSATANTNYVVMYQGRSIPFYVNTPNNASTKVYFRVDVEAGGSTFVDIYYGSSISNTVTNDKIDDAGMALTSATFSNTQWEWDAPFTITTNPRGGAGSWVAGKFGTQPAGVYTAIKSESGTVVDIDYTTTVNANDVDGFSCVIPAGAGTTNALTNLSRDDVGTFGGNLFVKKRLAGQLNWTTVDTKNGGAPTTTAIDCDNAVQLAIFAEGTGSYAEWTLSGGANLTLVLDSTKTPTVTIGSAVTARIVNSALTNTTTGDVITFTNVYLDDVALTINTTTKTITVASGPVYGAITMSNADEWMPLTIGSNAWTNPVNSSASFAWSDRFMAA